MHQRFTGSSRTREEEARELMGRDFWRYGLDSNRKELDLVMRYTHEQGLVRERRSFEQMFHRSTI